MRDVIIIGIAGGTGSGKGGIGTSRNVPYTGILIAFWVGPFFVWRWSIIGKLSLV